MVCLSTPPPLPKILHHPGAVLTRIAEAHWRSLSTRSSRLSWRVPSNLQSAPQSADLFSRSEGEDDEEEEHPEITRAQAVAISRLPPKMTKRCRALMKRIICFSAQRGSLPLLLSAWVKATKPRRADWLSVLKEMERSRSPFFLPVFQLALSDDSFEANTRDYTKIIGALAQEARFHDAEAAFSAMKARNLYPDQIALTQMVNLYSKAGMFDRAEETFEEIRLLGGDSPDRKAYGAMIMAHVRAGVPEEGEKLLREMDSREISACREIYKALLRAYSMAGRCDGAERVFSATQLAGVVPDARLCALLMHAYRAAGRTEDAVSVLENMRAGGVEPSDKCVALVVGALRDGGQLDRAVALLLDLERNGIPLGAETAEVLTEWFVQLGLSEELAGIL